jgi:hypothetical protein
MKLMLPRTGENPDASRQELAGEVFLGLARHKFSSASPGKSFLGLARHKSSSVGRIDFNFRSI